MHRCLIKCLSLTMAMVFVLSAVSCGRSGSTNKYTWVDSCIPDCGELVSGVRLEDDFAAGANAEWIKSQKYDPVYENGTYKEVNVLVDQNKRKLLDDKSVTGSNLELVRSFDRLYSDWDKRDELGAEPIRKYLERIDSIKNVQDAVGYMIDNEGNPFAVMPFTLGTIKSDLKKDHLCLNLIQPVYSLGGSSVYGLEETEISAKKAAVKDKVSYILKKLGYPEGDINSIVDSCISFETKMAGINQGGDYVLYGKEVIGKDEFLAKTSMDLNAVLEHYKLGNTVNYTGDMDYLKGLDSVFTDDNIEGIKSYFKVQLVVNSALLLDTDIFDYGQEAELDRTNPFIDVDVSYPDRYLFRTIQKSPLCGAMEQAYLDAYYDQAVHDDVVGILEQLREGYREIIKEKDWLSDESKANILEKLDNMIFCVMKPSNEADYGDMAFASYEEGGTLIDAYCKLNRFKIEHYGELTGMQYDRGFWDIHDTRIPTTKTGDVYDSSANKIIVMIGILYGEIYSYDMPMESKLGAIGTVLGHEMSHAFDAGGVYQDKEGDHNSIISGTDLMKFNKKAADVKAYYAGIEPFEGSGSYTEDNNLSSEAIADMGGMSCTLRIAKKISGFDLDRYFRAYAALWRRFTPRWEQFECVRGNDEHPLAYLRINVTVQQFEEFYETYNIRPEDHMYLPADERIAIW